MVNGKNKHSSICNDSCLVKEEEVLLGPDDEADSFSSQEKKAENEVSKKHSGKRAAISSWKRFWIRRKFLVYPYLQLHLLANSLVCLGVFVVVLVGSILFPLVLKLQDYSSEEHDINNLASTLLYFHDRYWMIFGIGGILVILISIRTSHKVAGALFNFRRVFKKMADGQVPSSIRLRSGDLLHREELELNRALQGFWSSIKEIEDARAGLRELIANTRGETQVQLRTELNRLNRGLENLQRCDVDG